MNKTIVFTIHKAASTFLYQLMVGITEQLRIEFLSLNDNRHRDAIRASSWSANIAGTAEPAWFGPVRIGACEPTIPQILDKSNVIVHVRDPRDVLTSLYYSYAYSHVSSPESFNPSDRERNQWREMGIDRFVIGETEEFVSRYERICTRLIGRPNVCLLTYEELVTRYDLWLRKFLRGAGSLGISGSSWWSRRRRKKCEDRLYREFWQRHCGDFNPAADRAISHVRQVAPGDHRRKLRSETIEHLNSRFSTILRVLDYPLDQTREVA